MAEKPTRLKIPSPDARSARSPFEGRALLFDDGNGVDGVASTGVLTLALNAGNTETVTIDTKVYTFQTVLTDVDGNVLIGATPSDSLDNLIAAINLDPAGAGTLYAASMTLHPTVSAAAGAGDTMDATAKDTGTDGDAIATTETLAGAGNQWGAAVLGGGSDPAAVAFVPVVQWGQMRIRVRITGSTGTLGVQFARPARQVAPGTGVDAFVYAADVPTINATALADGVEQSLEIPATEHIGENWLKLTLEVGSSAALLDFLDISGELLGTYH